MGGKGLPCGSKTMNEQQRKVTTGNQDSTEFSTVWKNIFHGVENFPGRALIISRSYAPLAALAGYRRAQGPRQREDALSRSLRSYGRAVVAAPPDHAAYGGCRECGFWRGGEAGGCGFPRLGFPPGAPLSEAPLSVCGSSAGGQTHPRSLTSFVHWGQPRGGQFRSLCRRPAGPLA